MLDEITLFKVSKLLSLEQSTLAKIDQSQLSITKRNYTIIKHWISTMSCYFSQQLPIINNQLR